MERRTEGSCRGVSVGVGPLATEAMSVLEPRIDDTKEEVSEVKQFFAIVRHSGMSNHTSGRNKGNSSERSPETQRGPYMLIAVWCASIGTL